MKTFLVFLLFSMCFVFSAAWAKKTPDGVTPAEEDICDGQIGAAFGLCNAYCEAMDCDSDSPNANESACLKVKYKFMTLTGEPDMPCDIEVSCPCFTTEDLLVGDISECANDWLDEFGFEPGALAALNYGDGRAACSGVFCFSEDESELNCAIDKIVGQGVVTVIQAVSPSENAACKSLILAICPD